MEDESIYFDNATAAAAAYGNVLTHNVETISIDERRAAGLADQKAKEKAIADAKKAADIAAARAAAAKKQDENIKLREQLVNNQILNTTLNFDASTPEQAYSTPVSLISNKEVLEEAKKTAVSISYTAEKPALITEKAVESLDYSKNDALIEGENMESITFDNAADAAAAYGNALIRNTETISVDERRAAGLADIQGEQTKNMILIALAVIGILIFAKVA